MTTYYLQGLHDNWANDDCAIDKMAARFSQTDDSATYFFLEKKDKEFFSCRSQASQKLLLGALKKTLSTPHGIFLNPGGSLILSLKEIFLTLNW